MPRKTILSLILALAVTFVSGHVQAAGLLFICTSGGLSCSDANKIFPTYRSNGSVVNVNYRTDQGGLGEVSDPSGIVALALQPYNDLGSTRLQFTSLGQLDNDINGTNFSSILEPSSPLGFTAIVFDDDGAITDAFFGSGARNSVLGFAGPTFVSVTQETISESQALFNGTLFTAASSGSSQQVENNFRSTILHEMAHAIGIDHTQGGFLDEFLKARVGQPASLNKIPIMFPILANPGFSLLRDDIAAVSSPEAYRDPSFDTNFGTIRGELRSSTGAPLKGGNVTAYKIDDTTEAVSSASDLFVRGTGEFILPGLVPGTYILKVEPIFSDFTGASSVGPFDPPANSNLFPEGFLAPASSSDELLDISLDNALSQARQIEVSANQIVVVNIGADVSSSLPRTFSIRGRSVRNTTVVSDGETTSGRIRIVKERRRRQRLTLQLSSSNPSLVTVPTQVSIGRRRRAKGIEIIFADAAAFESEFEDFATRGAEITITAIDTNTGFTDSEITLRVVK